MHKILVKSNCLRSCSSLSMYLCIFRSDGIRITEHSYLLQRDCKDSIVILIIYICVYKSNAICIIKKNKTDISKAVHSAFLFPYCLKTFSLKNSGNCFNFGCSVTLAQGTLWQKTQH